MVGGGILLPLPSARLLAHIVVGAGTDIAFAGRIGRHAFARRSRSRARGHTLLHMLGPTGRAVPYVTLARRALSASFAHPSPLRGLDPETAGKFLPRDKKSGRPGWNGGSALRFDHQPNEDSLMTARRYQSDRGAPRPREIRHRLPRAFDDSGVDQLDEWMTACPGADTPQPSL